MIVVHLQGGLPAAVIEDVKAIARRHPGDDQIVLRVGRRSVGMGCAWRCDAAAARPALAELGEIEESAE